MRRRARPSYEKLGGEVIYAGKPYAPIYDAALSACAKGAGAQADPRRVLAIGDGFRTDVFGARRAGLDVLFVAGGIHLADIGDLNSDMQHAARPVRPRGDLAHGGDSDIAALIFIAKVRFRSSAVNDLCPVHFSVQPASC